MKNTLILTVISFIIWGCNKDKQLSNRFSGETWQVTAIKIEGKNEKNLPVLQFNECKIYKENCTAKWLLSNTEARFIWQIRDKGKIFEISNQSEMSDEVEPAIFQCTNFSGIYTIKNETKTTIELSSFATIGYNGDEVVIEMEKQ